MFYEMSSQQMFVVYTNGGVLEPQGFFICGDLNETMSAIFRNIRLKSTSHICISGNLKSNGPVLLKVAILVG